MELHQAKSTTNSSFGKVLNILDKYGGLQYYLSTLNYLVIWCIYLKTNQPAYLAAYYFTFIYSGKILPKDDLPVKDSVKQNKNNLLLIPLVLQSISIWITVIGIFITFPFFQYTLLQTIIMSILLMVIISVSVGAAHELMHRHETIFKAMAKLQVSIALFTVYPFTHIHFHHKYVGTEKDFITSPKNKNTYMYALQVFPKAYSCVYKNNKSQFYNCIAVILGYIITLYCIALQQGCTFKIAMLKVGYMIIIGLGGYYLFEFVQATEHYGLLYRKNAQQKDVLQICAWNSEQNIVLNWMGFRFQRHSDHHMNAYKIYTTTQLTEQMPKIPFSVFEAFIFSTIPPLWYKIMNPYVQNVMQGKAVQASHSKFVQRAKISTMTILLVAVWYLAFSAFCNALNKF